VPVLPATRRLVGGESTPRALVLAVPVLSHLALDRSEYDEILTQQFRDWLVTLDDELAEGRWVQNGPPHIVLDGWPDKTPPR
jgi:hypothetical protein